jgi:hypothetical protein
LCENNNGTTEVNVRNKQLLGKKWFEVKGRPVLGFCAAAAAREAGIKSDKLIRDLQAGRIPEGELDSGKKRYYTQTQVEEIRRHYERVNREESTWDCSAISRELGVPRIVLTHHWKHGNIPSPHRDKEDPYWTPTEFSQIKHYFETRRYAKDRLMQLRPGLRELGATESEIWFLTNHHVETPEPELDLGAARSRYYTRQQLVELLRAIRSQRAERGLSD